MLLGEIRPWSRQKAWMTPGSCPLSWNISKNLLCVKALKKGGNMAWRNFNVLHIRRYLNILERVLKIFIYQIKLCSKYPCLFRIFSLEFKYVYNCLLMDMQLYKMYSASHYLTLLTLKVSEMRFIQSVVKENNQGCISSIFHETNLKSKVVPEILTVLLF